MESLRSIGSLQEELNQYVNKVKQDEPPKFICDTQNHINLSLIADTLDRAIPRVAQLAAVDVQKPHTEPPSGGPIPSSSPAANQGKASPDIPHEKPKFLTARLPLLSEVWNGSDPANYHMQIEVGVKNVPFYVTVDTGSSLLWLQSNVDGSEFIPDQNMFLPSQGKAAHVGDTQDTEIVYGGNRKVQMSMYEDQVNMGGLIASKQCVGAVTKVELGDSLRKARANGLMGLGTTLDDSDQAVRRNLAQTLFAEGKIQFPSFSFVGPRNDPAVARKAIDERTWQQPRGEFVVGTLPDEVQDEGGITWCPLRGNEPNRWIIRLNEVLVNGESLFSDQFALIDSGTSYVITSNSNVDDLRDKLGGKATVLKGKTSNNLFTFPPENLKSIVFNFGRRSESEGTPGNDRSFPLFNEDLNLGRDDSNQCVSSIVSPSKFPFPDNYWILGGIFIDNFVVTFDFSEGNRKIGFATLGSNGPVETTGQK